MDHARSADARASPLRRPRRGPRQRSHGRKRAGDRALPHRSLRLAYEGSRERAAVAHLQDGTAGTPERRLEHRPARGRVLRQGGRRDASGNLASMLRGGVGREDERLAAHPRRPWGFAQDRYDLAAAADLSRVRDDPSRLGAVPCALVGRPSPRRVDRRLGRRRSRRSISQTAQGQDRRVRGTARRSLAASAKRPLTDCCSTGRRVSSSAR